MLPQQGIDPTVARKKRKEIISNLRLQNTTKRLKEEEDDHTISTQDTDKTTTKTKYQNHYEPDIPMTKEQAAEWRKEARRKRNRESAAASRNKVRNRIAELEQEVQDWKDKYSTLLTRIESLEQVARLTTATTTTTGGFSRDAMVSPPTLFSSNRQLCVSPCLSPTSSPSSETHGLLRIVDVDYLQNHNDDYDHEECMMDKLRLPLNLNEQSQPQFLSSNEMGNHLDIDPDTDKDTNTDTDTEKKSKRYNHGDSSVVVSVVTPPPHEFHLNPEKTSRPAESSNDCHS
eukprot:CAMPEP_0176479364 /NCGR_PEP_ID=MMETSP0200_2-20121128/1700_1 /TAXON_ID=947934 /ORGANISM="Chaetoceros sp., Strain GSL56" /LENGTH=286 /DNA_ID=CAMNT_0017875403 /DNA_START=123 /DNA_END=983 /DNA_ORIENTATION=+